MNKSWAFLTSVTWKLNWEQTPPTSSGPFTVLLYIYFLFVMVKNEKQNAGNQGEYLAQWLRFGMSELISECLVPAQVLAFQPASFWCISREAAGSGSGAG